MYHFVREHLRATEGRCTRSDLLDAMHADAKMSERLSQSQGFDALLKNMAYSREIELEGDEVIASPKAIRRWRTTQP